MALDRREALILAAVAVGTATLGGVLGAVALQSRSGAAELLGIALTDLSGRSRRLLDWQGKVLLCNFWATWCAPCREEIPLLNAAQQHNGELGLQVVGIAIDNVANIRKFEESTKITYPVLVADAGAIDLMRRLGNERGGLPFNVILDRRGRLAQRKLGAFSEAELVSSLAALLR